MTTIIRYTLLCVLLPLGVYTLYFSSYRNGLLPLVRELVAKGQLPGSPDVVPHRTFTGLRLVDRALSHMVVFYWPFCNNVSVVWSLAAAITITSTGAAWFLLVVEASRTVSAPRVFFLTAIVGTFLTLLGPPIALPVYFFAHLSSLPHKPIQHANPAAFIQKTSLLGCTIVNYFVPILLILLVPSPETISHSLKQLLVAFFQGWAIFTSLDMALLYILRSNPSVRQISPPSNLHSVYRFAFVCATLPHLFLVLVFVAVTCNLLPDDKLHLGDLFTIVPPWSAAPVSAVGEGVLRFLQWEYAIGGASFLLWSIALYIWSCEQRKLEIGYFSLLAKVLALTAAVGPGGAAVVLIWIRDEIEDAGSGKGKQS